MTSLPPPPPRYPRPVYSAARDCFIIYFCYFCTHIGQRACILAFLLCARNSPFRVVVAGRYPPRHHMQSCPGRSPPQGSRRYLWPMLAQRPANLLPGGRRRQRRLRGVAPKPSKCCPATTKRCRSHDAVVDSLHRPNQCLAPTATRLLASIPTISSITLHRALFCSLSCLFKPCNRTWAAIPSAKSLLLHGNRHKCRAVARHALWEGCICRASWQGVENPAFSVAQQDAGPTTVHNVNNCCSHALVKRLPADLSRKGQPWNHCLPPCPRPPHPINHLVAPNHLSVGPPSHGGREQMLPNSTLHAIMKAVIHSSELGKL